MIPGGIDDQEAERNKKIGANNQYEADPACDFKILVGHKLSVKPVSKRKKTKEINTLYLFFYSPIGWWPTDCLDRLAHWNKFAQTRRARHSFF